MTDHNQRSNNNLSTTSWSPKTFGIRNFYLITLEWRKIIDQWSYLLIKMLERTLRMLWIWRMAYLESIFIKLLAYSVLRFFHRCIYHQMLSLQTPSMMPSWVAGFKPAQTIHQDFVSKQHYLGINGWWGGLILKPKKFNKINHKFLDLSDRIKFGKNIHQSSKVALDCVGCRVTAECSCIVFVIL